MRPLTIAVAGGGLIGVGVTRLMVLGFTSGAWINIVWLLVGVLLIYVALKREERT